MNHWYFKELNKEEFSKTSNRVKKDTTKKKTIFTRNILNISFA
jgi:hypothetical protein